MQLQYAQDGPVRRWWVRVGRKVVLRASLDGPNHHREHREGLTGSAKRPCRLATTELKAGQGRPLTPDFGLWCRQTVMQVTGRRW